MFESLREQATAGFRQIRSEYFNQASSRDPVRFNLKAAVASSRRL
jgi:hypothetical protein